MKKIITLTSSKNFYVGDIEEVENEETFVRVYYNEEGLKTLNDILKSHISMDEWITLVLNSNKKIVKIVVYSRNDSREYDITYLFSTDMINKLLREVDSYERN